MQDTEAAQASSADNAFKTDLDISYLIPDWLQPVWDFFVPYPGLLTLLLIAVAWLLGKVLKIVITRSMEKLVSKTSNKIDDHLVEYLTRPLVLTTVTLAMMLAVSAFPLPSGVHDASLSILATVLLFSWSRAGLRTARIV
ncbi:MAG: hypothetical protein GQ538_11590, partial [Xanthomonadales bacterium]|nr:hypothetical protein [Xanthomonadales bacterium]